MADPPGKERFIPVRKADLVDGLSNRKSITPEERGVFLRFSSILDSLFHFEFHTKIESLEENYHPFNPDNDTITVRRFSREDRSDHEARLMAAFKAVLNQANYQQITATDLAFAMNRESLFKIDLFVDFEDFENQLIFRRGVRSHRIRRKKWLFKEEPVDVTIYDRVALIIKYKDEPYFKARKRKDLNFSPGTMIVKLFKNIPKGDLEMLFPNAQVRMKLKDKLLMGGFAVGGGISVVVKAGAGLVAMASILWLMSRAVIAGSGEIPTVGPVEISGMVGGVTALAAIGAFLFKQWNSYKNRKIKFMKTLGDNLYFKNLDNNAGVFYHIIADAEEEEFKEALLAYIFLADSEAGLTAKALDEVIEGWFKATYGAPIDFEIEDALGKLKRLKLCDTAEIDETGQPVWTAVSLTQACQRLDFIWDNLFQMNAPQKR
jgi:hypothetical protein